MARAANDRVTVEILRNYFTAIAERMGYALERTAHSTFIKESADFATGMATPSGEFFAYPRALGVSSFLGLNLATAIAAFDDYQDGDVVIVNDPYTSGGLATHLPDIHLFRPIFVDGEILCFAWCFVHSTDVGGLVPSSISQQASDVHQEGLRVPPYKLYSAGHLDQPFVSLFLANCRTPSQNWGDLNAMVAALETGRAGIESAAAKFGASVIRDSMAAVLNWTESRARRILSRIPDGEYSFADYLDDDGDGAPIRLQVKLRVRDTSVELDYEGTDPQVNLALNLAAFGPRHPFLAQGLINFILSEDPGMPLTGGIVRPLTVSAPRGSIVNPTYPAAIGVRYAVVIRLYNVVLGALAKAVGDNVPAPGTGQAPLVALASTAIDRETGHVAVLEPVYGGGGATSRCDGVAGIDSAAGYLKNTPIETTEVGSPVLAERYELLPDSAGAGQYRGGWGVLFAFRSLQSGSVVSIRGMERTRFEPWGLLGGRAAGRTSAVLNRGTAAEQRFGRVDVLRLEPGETFTLLAGGGGGWGNPYKRSPELVLADVHSGLLSVKSAEDDYGVEIRGDRIDYRLTSARREEALANSTTPELYDLGPSRREYERGWSDELSTALVKFLMTIPAGSRPYAKRRVRAQVEQMERKPRSVAELQRIWDELQVVDKSLSDG